MTALPPPDAVETLNQCVARLQRRLAVKLEALQRQATPASAHAARSAARRLHAVLAICKHYVCVRLSRKYLRSRKRITRKLGQLHDMDVAQQSIDKLASVAHRLSSDELKSLRRALNSRRHRMAFALHRELSTSPEAHSLATRTSHPMRPDFVMSGDLPTAVAGLVVLNNRRIRL